MIIGGHAQQFAKTQQAFSQASAHGAGEVKVILPDTLRKTIGDNEAVEYVASTNTGSISKEARSNIEAAIGWADGVLFPGELSKNSETEVLITDILQSITKPTVLHGELTELVSRMLPLEKPEVTILLERPSAQLMGSAIKLTQAITTTSTQEQIRSVIKNLAIAAKMNIVFNDDLGVLCAANDELSQTSLTGRLNDVALMCHSAILTMQFPEQTFAALTSAIYLAGGGEVDNNDT